jgi:hypothetical protein
MIVAPQLVILTEKSPFFSTYTPTIFLASAPSANAKAARHKSARNTGALAIAGKALVVSTLEEDVCFENTGRGVELWTTTRLQRRGDFD